MDGASVLRFTEVLFAQVVLSEQVRVLRSTQ
jgi:hypothetical protein